MSIEEIFLVIIGVAVLILTVRVIYLKGVADGSQQYKLLNISELAILIKDNGPVEVHEISQGEETYFKVLIKK